MALIAAALYNHSSIHHFDNLQSMKDKEFTSSETE